MTRFFQAVLGLFLTTIFVTTANAADQLTNLCGKWDSWNSTNPKFPYLFINNAWGNDSSGFSCLNVINKGAEWSVTYKWTGTPTLVKGYPHMKARPTNLPVQLGNISRLLFRAEWQTYILSAKDSSASVQAAAMTKSKLRANVAIDMFLSDDPTNSTQSNPPVEIMIWPWYIPTVKPLGWSESTPDTDTVTVGGVQYSLYHGWNDGGQHVFSWLARKNTTKVDVDYIPLLRYIWQKGLLSPSLWVGQLEFGTEVLYAGDTTVFQAEDYNMTLVRAQDEPPKAEATKTVTVVPTPSATAGNSTMTRGQASITSAGSLSSTTSRSAAGMSLRLDGGSGISTGLLLTMVVGLLMGLTVI